jgi:hypothetical protein
LCIGESVEEKQLLALSFWLEASAEADPCGMTTKKTMAMATAEADSQRE